MHGFLKKDPSPTPPHKGEGLTRSRSHLRAIDISILGDNGYLDAAPEAREAPPPCGEGLGRGLTSDSGTVCGVQSPPLRWGPQDGARPVARANKPDRAEGGIDPGLVLAASPPSVTYGDISPARGEIGESWFAHAQSRHPSPQAKGLSKKPAGICIVCCVSCQNQGASLAYCQ